MMFETVLVFGPIIAQFALILCWNAAFEAFVTPQRVFGFVWSSASGAFVAHPVGIYQRMQRKIPNPTCHVISKVKRAKRKHNYVSICAKKSGLWHKLISILSSNAINYCGKWMDFGNTGMIETIAMPRQLFDMIVKCYVLTCKLQKWFTSPTMMNSHDQLMQPQNKW